ncbi:MAG TPA: TAT-variant-translocated molybdopterin oxidoreductase [Terriglobales bacterium]|nr:TAT-variant-translocated molybdopterin oxidoreductase [Terriglobales bacterium]
MMERESAKPGCKEHAAKLVNIAKKTARKLDLAAIREKLSKATGPTYWRSLEELAEEPGFDDVMHREFPRLASEWPEGCSRRDFLRLAGASLALAGLAGCTKQPLEPIVPYVVQPERIVLGQPLYFATAFPVSGIARPIIVKSMEGRPIKVEGNPQHGASLGAADAHSQAAVLGLYDPDRSQTIGYNGTVRPWGTLQANIRAALSQQQASGGAGLRFLTETVTSPTLAGQIAAVLKQFPNAKWHQYEPVNRDNVKAGAQIAFGQAVDTTYHLDKADVILSLEADLFAPTGLPGFQRYTRDFTLRRKMKPGVAMNRLYVVESTPSLTGVKADHRLPMRSSDIHTFAGSAAVRIFMAGVRTVGAPPDQQRWLSAVVNDLKQHRGTSLVVVGDQQPAEVHALAHAMNQAIENVGTTLTYVDPVEANPVDQTASLKDLVADMDAGKVQVLAIVGGNPAYNAPADLGFADKLSKVGLRIHLGMYEDETSALCQWHVPEAHPLETWSDARAYDGTVSIIQPLIAPLFNGRSAHEFMAVFSQQPEQSSYDVVRGYWRSQFEGRPEDFESTWRKWLHDGFMAGSESKPRTVAARTLNLPALERGAQGTEVVFQPDPSVYDGRWANNAWLQELPKPLTKLTWDNAVLVGPALSERMNLRTGNVVEVEHRRRKLRGPVLVAPGQAEDSITLVMGYGRTRGGNNGSKRGYSAFQLRTSDAPWIAGGVKMTPTGEDYPLALTQNHQVIDHKTAIEETIKRAPVREATLAEFIANPRFAQEMKEEPAYDETLYPKYEYNGYKWGMAIDLNSCVGCNACLVACQAENNIPVVGKDQVRRERHMNWLRLDAYNEGDLANPRTLFQPVPCMQCENAPCELVCPVAATVHSSEGLNDMVYNRCVGTRYCSNNCPYKVRRFNFLLFSDWNTPTLKLLHNPDVTVRSRGVMEKCTYCIQRITRARIESEKEQRKIRDQEVQTACQQACPAEAIIFGDLNDKDSKVARLKADPRNYGLLAELNTRPRTTYLAAVRNPNPELEKKG